MELNESNEKTTETVPKATKSPKTTKFLIFLLVLLLILSAILAYVAYTNSDLIVKKDQEIAQLQNEVAAAASATQEDAPEAKKADNSNQGNTAQELPVVIFTPGGLFEEALKQEITTKLIEPYVDYQKDQGSNAPVSIHVQHSVTNSSDPEFAVDVIYGNEVYEGFLYGDNTKTDQPWYQPQCLDACEFSDDYKTKYPEVVAGSTP